MIKLTTKLFNKAAQPPAVIQQVVDFAMTRVEAKRKDDVYLLLLELKHPEIDDSFHQLFAMPTDLFTDLIDQLTSHKEYIDRMRAHDF
jgi:hypothetical protein